MAGPQTRSQPQASVTPPPDVPEGGPGEEAREGTRASHMGRPRGQGPPWAVFGTRGVCGGGCLQMSRAGGRPDCGQLRRIPALPHGSAGRRQVRARQERSGRTWPCLCPGALPARPVGAPCGLCSLPSHGRGLLSEARGPGTGPEADRAAGTASAWSWALNAAGGGESRRESRAQRATCPGPDASSTKLTCTYEPAPVRGWGPAPRCEPASPVFLCLVCVSVAIFTPPVSHFPGTIITDTIDHGGAQTAGSPVSPSGGGTSEPAGPSAAVRGSVCALQRPLETLGQWKHPQSASTPHASSVGLDAQMSPLRGMASRTEPALTTSS